MALIQIFMLLAVTCFVKAEYKGHPVGYSYAKFSGPVSGPAMEVHTHDEHKGHTVDYVSKPDYQFEYGVEDPKSQVSQFRKENREGDAVVGEYSYTDPLGHVRTVKYTADKLHGFRAEIFVDGTLEAPHSSSHNDAQEAHAASKKASPKAPPQAQPESGDSGDYSEEDY